MELKLIAKPVAKAIVHAGKIFKKNLPTILSVVACGGVVLTGYLAGKEGHKAIETFEAEKEDGKVTVKTIAKTAKVIAPAVVSGGLTIAAIATSSKIYIHRIDLLTASYKLVAKNFSDYKRESGKILKDTGKVAVATAIGKENLPKDGLPDINDGKDWFYDYYTHTWFRSDFKTVLTAQLEIEQLYLKNGYVGVMEYYERLNCNLPLSIAKMFEDFDFCWDCDFICTSWELPFIGFGYWQIKLDDGRTAYVIGSDVDPVPYDHTSQYECYKNREWETVLDMYYDEIRNTQNINGEIISVPSDSMRDPEALLRA